MLFAQGECSHGTAWQSKPSGISKTTGKPYNAFYAASHKLPDGSWCREKPSADWVKANPIDAPAPKLVPEDLGELPF